MKKIILLGSITALLFTQCTKNKDPFEIKKNAIGDLTNTTKMKQLDSLFANDSIVKTHSSPNALETQGEVEIYEKGGKKLLLLSPADERDPNSTITDIIIFDPRYQTDNGLNTNSTFKDFKDNYTVSDIQRIINGVMVFFSDTDIYLTIDAKNLPEAVRNNRDSKIEVSDIPDAAPIKYFRIGWEPGVN